MSKKLFAAVVAVLLCCMLSVTAVAAPYYNYSFHRGFVTAEPQAYTPYKVISSSNMNIGGLVANLKDPADMAASDVNGDIAIADTGNNRIVIIDMKYQRKQVIGEKVNDIEVGGGTVWDEETQQYVAVPGNKINLSGFFFGYYRTEDNRELPIIRNLNAPEGVFFDKSGNLYVCDTGNGRIIRFALNTVSGQYECDKIFAKPAGLDELLKAEDETGTNTSADPNASVDPNASAEPNASASPEESAEPQETSDAAEQSFSGNDAASQDVQDATETASPEATEAPGEQVTEAPGEQVTEAPGEEVTEAPGEQVTEAPTKDPNEITRVEIQDILSPADFVDEKAIGDPSLSAGGQYKPTKMVVTDAGAMYVVSKGNHKGFIELSSDGSFTKFTGAPKTKQTLSALLSRILTDEQKKGQKLNLSTEYSNICLDTDGMIYGTISSIEGLDLLSHFQSKAENGAAIRRISPTGDDILKRNDVYPPSGDMGYDGTRENFSAMVDIAVASDGIYSALDSNKGRVFTYNNEGELLFIFGAKGSVMGSFTKPTAIGLFKFAAVSDGIIDADDPEAETYEQMIIAVLDSTTAQITLFKPTEYGKLIRSATMCQQTRKYDEAIQLWNEVLDHASNSRLAFNGLGRIQYVRGEYEAACENFKKAYNQGEYSVAYAKLRNEHLEVAMPYIMTVLVGLVVLFVIKAIVTKFRRFIKTGGKSANE